MDTHTLTIDLNSYPTLASKARLQIDRVSKEPILLYPEGVLQLNQSGALIASLCDGQHTFLELLQEIARRYRTSPAVLRYDVSEFLRLLFEQSLLELRD